MRYRPISCARVAIRHLRPPLLPDPERLTARAGGCLRLARPHIDAATGAGAVRAPPGTTKRPTRNLPPPPQRGKHVL